jgi:hypothetical protein
MKRNQQIARLFAVAIDELRLMSQVCEDLRIPCGSDGIAASGLIGCWGNDFDSQGERLFAGQR